MVGGPMLTELFTYQYRPNTYSRGRQDGGFKIALFGNNTLVYTEFTELQTVRAVHTFWVREDVLSRYMMILDGESWWVCHQPLNIGGSLRHGYTSMIGVTGHPMFTVEDLEQQARRPFNDERGMLARRMYMMLESVASILIPSGLYLMPCGFQWDSRVTAPIPVTGRMAM